MTVPPVLGGCEEQLARLPLNPQRHATVKTKGLLQQQSCTEQLSIAMWPTHELKSNR